MLTKITHTTNLSYADLISETAMELRTCPRQEQDQHRLSFNLAIGPATSVTSYFDWLGNTVHAFNINAFHREIRIVATSIVEVDRPSRDPASLPDRWPVPAGDASGCYDYDCYDYLQFGGPVVDSPELSELVKSLDPTPGMPLGQLAQKMLRLINEKFSYQTGVTTVASPITDLLRHGRGVCQDFTHLMIGMARKLGIPARYVSGLLHSRDDTKYRGYSQTHAWCEWNFPSLGWIGFDPLNNCLVGDLFVKVAVGRYYADVPPNKGTRIGSAEETMEVKVSSEELPAIPAQLAAERMQAIEVPTYAAREIGREAIRQLEEQQQQQQQQHQA